jgi:hypothetical protein
LDVKELICVQESAADVMLVRSKLSKAPSIGRELDTLVADWVLLYLVVVVVVEASGSRKPLLGMDKDRLFEHERVAVVLLGCKTLEEVVAAVVVVHCESQMAVVRCESQMAVVVDEILEEPLLLVRLDFDSFHVAAAAVVPFQTACAGSLLDVPPHHHYNTLHRHCRLPHHIDWRHLKQAKEGVRYDVQGSCAHSDSLLVE